MDAGTITALGGAAVLVLGFFGALIREIDKARVGRITLVEGQLKDCHEEHAAAREELGGLREAVKYLSRTQPPHVQAVVEETLNKSETRRSQPHGGKDGN